MDVVSRRRCGSNEQRFCTKMSSSSGEVDKTLLAFLNGLARRQFFGENQFTDEFLRDEVLGNISEDDYAVLLKRFHGIILSMASADMDYTQLDAFLTSQMKKRQGALSEIEAATLRRFWKTQKNKIHERLVAGTTWDSSLKHLSWRVDVQSKARHIDQLNQPSVIVELKLGPAGKEEVNDVVRFELNSEKLSELVSQVNDIQKTIDTYMQV